MVIVLEKSALPLQGLKPPQRIELGEGTSIRALLQRHLAIGDDELYLLPVVNGGSRRLDDVLQDGDSLCLLWLSAGG